MNSPLTALTQPIPLESHDDAFALVRLLEGDLILDIGIQPSGWFWSLARWIEGCAKPSSHAHTPKHGVEHVKVVKAATTTAGCSVRPKLIVYCPLRSETAWRYSVQLRTSFGSSNVSYACPIVWNVSWASGSSGFLSCSVSIAATVSNAVV